MAKAKTNVQFVRDLMEHSQFGAMTQLFVLDALDKWSGMVAKEIQEKINARTAG
ncbi:hypothetical protein [Bradyrhizobium sp. 2S1]|uniref:hypothetical protein n=1 Tax=Bradyrhizobium sp. 2S1 TaxID=1404429 RepID=UPI0014091040|nr:hypothetical protein [Bradyrhizobium sp. 2S1]MCK7669348.1 hypothetical protein [Bradyrhizobium sp. 2S1]